MLGTALPKIKRASLATLAIVGLLGASLPAFLGEAAVAAEATPGGDVATVGGVAKPESRGSLPVGAARYAFPSNAVFVDSVKGSDAQSGRISAPKKTVTAAIGATPQGGTVVLRAGNYHERVFVGKSVTIQGYPGEAAWFDGSIPVTGWRKDGSTYSAPWAFKSNVNASFTQGGAAAESDPFVNPAYPMAAHPDLAFYGGKALRQVDGVSTPVTPGTFAVRNGRLVIADDPAATEVRASDLEQALVIGTPNVTLQGFGVRRFANAVPTMGAVYLARQNNVIRHVVISDIATTGLDLISDGRNGAGVADHVTVERAGLMGIHGNWADNVVIKNSVVWQANAENFNATPTAGGIKITRSRNVKIDNNLVVDSNESTGIWLDEAVVGFSVTRNLVVGTELTGIAAELSSSGVIASNHIVGHKQGIHLFNTERTRVVNNTIGFSAVADVYMRQDYRRQSNVSHVGRDPRYAAGDPTNTWLLRDISLENNFFGPDGNQKSNFSVFVIDGSTNRSADAMNITMNGNAFIAPAKPDNAMAVGWGGADNVSVRQFATPKEWAAATGRKDANALMPAGTEFSEGMSSARSLGVAVPLPPDIAASVGAQVGMKIIGSLTG